MAQTSLHHATLKVRRLMIGLLLLSGGLGAAATLTLRSALISQEAAASLLRSHMTADMMHDAVRGDVVAIVASADPALAIDRTDSQESLKEHLIEFEARITETQAYTGNPAIAGAAAEVAAPLKAFEQSAKAIAAVPIEDRARAAAMLPGFFESFKQLETGMEKVTESIETYTQAKSRWSAIIAIAALLLVLASMGVAILIAAKVGTAVRRQLVEPLIALSGVIERMAAGDRSGTISVADRTDEVGGLARGVEAFRTQLNTAEDAKQRQAALIVDSIGEALSALARSDLTARVTVELAEPFTRLKDDYNSAAAALRDVIGEVREGADALSHDSSHIAEAANELAKRTQASAASIEQMSVALMDVDGRLRGSAAAASETVERADAGIASVRRGRDIADQAMEAMGRVGDSAKGIDSVIEGLDKIAFQTRVLAMNAAVEAGRAGEAGRGFAVVADLVSALAMRAEEEAKRARDQLTVTQEEIIAAVARVRTVDGAFADISTSVETVHEFVRRIATDNEAQSVAMGQIRSAIEAMDRATQQNAAMVEESSASAVKMSGQARKLAKEARRFELGHDDGPPTAVATLAAGSPVRAAPRQKARALEAA